jgi:hypothetical protein
MATASVPQAQALWDSGKYREAFAAAFEGAVQGDAQGQLLIGEAYEQGRSVTPDNIQAWNWYLRAARQGYVPAATALGRLLVRMRQSRDAVPWLTLGASHDDPNATALLAAIYATGDGADRDLILATTLMKKAAAEGSPEARAQLALMDDTAPPVDVSTPADARLAEAPPRSPAYVQVASASPKGLAVPAPRLTRSLKPMSRARTIQIQVGAFKSASNARRALTLVAARLSTSPSGLAVVRNQGFYKLVLLTSDRERATSARSRLTHIRWQHFVRSRRLIRV